MAGKNKIYIYMGILVLMAVITTAYYGQIESIIAAFIAGLDVSLLVLTIEEIR